MDTDVVWKTYRERRIIGTDGEREREREREKEIHAVCAIWSKWITSIYNKTETTKPNKKDE